MIPFLDLKAQQARLQPHMKARIEAVLGHCQFILGPEVGELEGRLAAYCGAAHCVGVSSGTDALQIAMMAEGIGPGDAVFLPAFTYTATAEVPLLLGMGLRCFSTNASSVPRVKQAVRGTTIDDCQRLTWQVMKQADPARTRALVTKFGR